VTRGACSACAAEVRPGHVLSGARHVLCVFVLSDAGPSPFGQVLKAYATNESRAIPRLRSIRYSWSRSCCPRRPGLAASLKALVLGS